MAGNNLSPRQKMIGMMYLVLTALLALNVSKEVLNAFQNVNGGIVRTTENFNSKNAEVYNQFLIAAETNPAKAGPWKDKALRVKSKSDSISALIQKLKYEIVLSADNKVTFSGVVEPLTTPYDELPNNLKNLLMVDIQKKSDRDKAGDIMINRGNGNLVKGSLVDFRDYLLTLTKGTSISNSLEKTFDFSDIQMKKGVSESWVNYNFNDMPLIAAITLLSKIQADVRNAESDAIKHLQKEIDAGSLKFTSAEAIQIAPSNYVFVGDSFKADVFLAAKDSTQNPVIYVGDYELDENGFYQMIGKYDSIPVKGGKGKYAFKTRKQGYQKWGGLIGMKTDEGVKMYPFSGEFQVAAQSFVVSPTKMNVLYLLGDMGNPIDVSVPGVSKDKIRVSCNNGVIKKVGGSWEVFPKTTGKAKITVSAEVLGKNSTMGTMDFRVKRVPKPEPKLIGSKNGKIKKNQILSKNCKMIAQLKDFDFDIKNTVVGFTLDGLYKGEIVSKKVLGNKLSDDMREFVKDLPFGSIIYISNITSKGPSGKKSNLGTIKVVIN
ncbi:MAG: GldM family protein [Flavobacteriales bacterium]